MNRKLLLLLAIFCQLWFYAKSNSTESIFVDNALSEIDVKSENTNSSIFHLFSHGRAGELFIDNQWMDVSHIAAKFRTELKGKKELYIYGCNFGAGEKGREAVQYLANHLNINVNASTNVTGEDGDWNLEIGNGKHGLKLPNFKGNLQLDNVHYLNPLLAGSYNNGTSIQEEFIYLSTPSVANITVQMNFASGIGSPRVSVTNLSLPLSSSNPSYSSTGSLTFNNANPIRLQFIDPGTTIVKPGLTPTTVATNTGGTIISGSTAGLVFSTPSIDDQFYVNYRARSTAQAGSMLTKGVAATGKEFRWGGSPILFKTVTSDLGNMLSVMATENDTNIRIDNIKPGTRFINGSSGATLMGPSISKTLQKGDSFILYAPVSTASTSIQDTGWLGAKVVSDKNVAVAVGGLMQQGASGDNRDIGFDQLVPVEKLGLEHVVMQGNGQSTVLETVIVVATEDNTDIFVNGSSTRINTTTLNAGDYFLIPGTFPGNFNAKRNMLVVVNRPSYVFHKIFGFDQGNTNSLMFIPPLSCFGKNTVDLIPSPTDIGNTSYTGTELSVLAVTSAGEPTVTQNGNQVFAYTANGGGAVTGNTFRTSYRYKLTDANSKVKVSSTEVIQAELFGASGDAGFGGYYSGFGEPPIYNVSISSIYGFLCPGTGTISIINEEGFGNTYQWYRNNTSIPGATSPTYTLNGRGDNVTASYYVVVTFPSGCSVKSNEVTSEPCPCTKPSTAGTPVSYTKMGISIRDKRTTADWPKDIPNGFIALESNNKGFVITRMASPETAINTPVLGMMVYDTVKNCLKLYNGTSWNCIKPTCN